MIRISATYARGKNFERDNVTKVVYTSDMGMEVIVEGNDLLTHHFPVKSDFVVYASDGMSSVSSQGLRAVSAFNIPEE